MFALATSGANPWGNVASGWYGDHATATAQSGNGDDEYSTWNHGQVNNDPANVAFFNNDGPGYASQSYNYQYRCCDYPDYGTCPSGFTKAGSLCYKKYSNSVAAHTAFETCGALGATVCMHQEMQSICGHGHDPYSGLATYGWYGDHGLAVESSVTNNWDDEYFMWNVAGCADNNDSTAYHQNRKSGPFVCCVETYPN